MADAAILIEPLIPSLRRYAAGLLRERSAADDLVQDTLERALSRWHQRRPEGDTRAWLFAILHSLAMNRLRQSARRGVHLALDAVDPGRFAQPPRQEEGLAYANVLQAMQSLPPEYRAVLLLVSVEGMTYAEVAGILGIPLGTVMSRLSRARERLAERLKTERNAAVIALRRVRS
jgi:RNA polymerase sigma-70 factor (ECF subfamily)